MGEDETNLRDEYYPAVVEGLIGKYRAAYVGKRSLPDQTQTRGKGICFRIFRITGQHHAGRRDPAEFRHRTAVHGHPADRRRKRLRRAVVRIRTERGQRAALHSALPLPDALRNRRIHHRPGPRLPGRSGPHPFRSGIRPAGRRSASARRGAPAAGEGAEGAQGRHSAGNTGKPPPN